MFIILRPCRGCKSGGPLPSLGWSNRACQTGLSCKFTQNKRIRRRNQKKPSDCRKGQERESGGDKFLLTQGMAGTRFPTPPDKTGKQPCPDTAVGGGQSRFCMGVGRTGYSGRLTEMASSSQLRICRMNLLLVRQYLSYQNLANGKTSFNNPWVIFQQQILCLGNILGFYESQYLTIINNFVFFRR